ncbi:MAG: FG-GAP repeat protein, partial [Ignavibacteriales bacterium]|nr:FG-GAP repeat protein [Ignavibacteriales bacterium]
GDINKDGYDDIIIGAYGYDIQKGKVYIFYGGSPMDTSPDITMTGESGSNRFGFSVANAGDLNKDGNDDYIIGAYGYSNSKGRAYIFYGGPSMDTTPDVTMTGEADGNNFGHSVSGAGDVNKDGYYDVIVGAPYNVSNRGRVYIFYGGASMDNTADVTINGEGLQNYFGYSVAGAGDVNKDGYDDVIVGAYKYNDTGRVYIFYGGSSMDENADVILTGENTGDQFGFFVSSAKDVNGDDISDILVGAQSNDDVELNGGKVYLYFGVLETLSLQLKVFLQGAYR